jgi:hypothetical protein
MKLKIKTCFGVLLISILFALAGCVGAQMEMQRDTLLKRGYPPEYADGFGDGYGSGLSAGGNPYAQTTKNINRYLEDPKYKMGWDDGFAKGKGNYDAIGNMMRK